MKIVILGDVHGRFREIDWIMDSTNASVYLQTGDLASEDDSTRYPSLSKPLIFCAGNHEEWDELEKFEGKKEICKIGKNLYYVPQGNYIDLGSLLNGKETNFRIGALGGNYSPKRYNLERSELRGERRRHYVNQDVEKTKKLIDIKILLTHEAPFPYKERGKGRKEITEILECLKPKYHFFGHHHRYSEQELIKGVKSIGLPQPHEGYAVLDTDDWSHHFIFS